ncbi:MAG: alpha/beta fold hydrolase [Nostocaceae cyanobacterium]|nr:alpha/beta fold hydrolase [Nostocaceae cyanobacterium]
MLDYFKITLAIVHQTKTREAAVGLINPACRSRFFFHPHPTEKVFILFHGFTAAPYQFEPMGKALFKEGYNVIIPLMPGHGQAGNWNRDNPPPLPTEPSIYQQFALDWLEIAKTFGKQVIVGGLSGGATLAAWLSLERPQNISKAILFAPFLSSSNNLVDAFVEVLPFYFEWLNKDNPGNFGYKGFRIPALRVFLDIGQDILERVANHPSVPMFLIHSASDPVIDSNEVRQVFRALLMQQPKSWYHCLDKALQIPHTMMTKQEGNNYPNLLTALTKAFVESDISWNKLIEIGYQILEGNTFDNAVNIVNSSQKVDPNVAVLLTVMDNQTIVDGHNTKLHK